MSESDRLTRLACEGAAGPTGRLAAAVIGNRSWDPAADACLVDWMNTEKERMAKWDGALTAHMVLPTASDFAYRFQPLRKFSTSVIHIRAACLSLFNRRLRDVLPLLDISGSTKDGIGAFRGWNVMLPIS